MIYLLYVLLAIVEEAAPGVGVEVVDAFAENRMGVKTFGGEGGQAEVDEGRVVGSLVGGDLESCSSLSRLKWNTRTPVLQGLIRI
jgi:hypothetical protein